MSATEGMAPPATWSGIPKGAIFRVDDWPFYLVAEVTHVRIEASFTVDENGKARVRSSAETLTIYVIDGRTYDEQPLRPGTILEFVAEAEETVVIGVSPPRPCRIRRLADVEPGARVGQDTLQNIADRVEAWDAYGKSMAFGRQFAASLAGGGDAARSREDRR